MQTSEKKTSKLNVFVDGIAAMESVEDGVKFYLLYIDEQHYSWYECHRVYSKLKITFFKKGIAHNLNETKQGDIQGMKGMPPDVDRILFVQTKTFPNNGPLWNALKSRYKDVRAVPDNTNVAVSGWKFCFPDIKLNLGPDMSFPPYELIKQHNSVHICLDDKTLSQVLVNSPKNIKKLHGLKIGDVLPDKEPDYKIDGVGVKILRPFFIEADAFQNVYLTINDIHGKKKRCCIYSHFAEETERVFMRSKEPDRIYYVVATPELHTILFDVLAYLLYDLRSLIVSMLENSSPDKNWLEQYKAAFKVDVQKMDKGTVDSLQDKLSNIEAAERKTRYNKRNLTDLIDWPSIEQVFRVHQNLICKYWCLKKTQFEELIVAISCLVKTRPDTAHLKSEYEVSQLRTFSSAPVTIAKYLKLKNFEFYDNKCETIGDILKTLNRKITQ